jgi:hypothetical protein
MERPVGVTVIAVYYVVIAAYLFSFGALKLITSGTFMLMPGALAGGIVWGLIGWGLLRLQKWGRWAGMLGMVPAIFLLVAPISMAKIGLHLLWYGLLIALHAAAGFYLAQAPTAVDAFDAK